MYLQYRQEIAVFALVLFVLFLYKKKVIPAVAIGIFPIIYNLLGIWKTGDPFFVLTEMKSVAALTVQHSGRISLFQSLYFHSWSNNINYYSYRDSLDFLQTRRNIKNTLKSIYCFMFYL